LEPRGLYTPFALDWGLDWDRNPAVPFERIYENRNM